jgi:hypothetical protein
MPLTVPFGSRRSVGHGTAFSATRRQPRNVAATQRDGSVGSPPRLASIGEESSVP